MTTSTYEKLFLITWLLFFPVIVPCSSQNNNFGTCHRFTLKSPQDHDDMNSFLQQLDFGQVERYVMFFGAPRTGHSWIGSVLDAAPDALVANEFHAFGWYSMSRGAKTQATLFTGLAKNSYICGKLGRYQIYNYTIPGLWQGKVAADQKLRVIGDKKGGASTRMLLNLGNESAWENDDAKNVKRQFFSEFMNNVVKVEPRFILVLRNPFDIIATHTIRYYERHKRVNPENMKPTVSSDMVSQILAYLRENIWIKQNLGESHQFYVLSMERFAVETTAEMMKLCEFVGITCPSIMLEKVEAQTHHDIHDSFLEVNWPDHLFDEVNDFIKEYLSEYYSVAQNPNYDADE